jgi:phospholipid transport system substrate-binding protein
VRFVGVLCIVIFGLCAVAAAPALAADPAPKPAASVADPAQATVARLHERLLVVMKSGKALGFRGRYAELKPLIEQTFDLPVMTRYAVGPRWAEMSEFEQQLLIGAFTRLTVANYAHNFDDWSGQAFVVDPNVVQRGADKYVKTRLVADAADTVSLLYRLRQAQDGTWKVIDVYYNGTTSQLLTLRNDFEAALAAAGPKAGAKALVDHIHVQADRLSH